MLARLRHDRVIGGYDQQGGIHTRGAGDHVVDETFVTGDVDQGEAAAIGVEMREAELDRDAASLLLREAVDGGAGQRLHQRRLAVIDMPGKADDKLAAIGGR